MRILYLGIGDTKTSRALPQSWPDRFFQRMVGRHEVVTFGYADGLDIRISLGTPFQAVLDALPEGWIPDVCVCTHVDYLMIPPGIEFAPFPTVAVTADWDFRIAVARNMAETFDLCVTLGEESCRQLEKLGARETLPFAYFGVPERTLEKGLQPSGGDRPIDVLFTGTINDCTHLDRSLWLRRLARLASRYRIHIGRFSAAPGAFERRLQQSKLVFTFHRRGELQLRFTDAVAQGALVLDNGVEAARHFDPQTEFALYSGDDFEEVVHRHLADEGLRRRKVEAARRRLVAEFGSLYRMERLFDALEDRLASTEFGPRPALSWGVAETARRRVQQLYASHLGTCLDSDMPFLEAAVAETQAYPGVAAQNDLAVVMLTRADDPLDGDLCGVRDRLVDLCAAWPKYVMGRFHLARVQIETHADADAERSLLAALELLGDPDSDLDPWALGPRTPGPEGEDFERCYNLALLELLEHGEDRPVRRVVTSECLRLLAHLCLRDGRIVDAHGHLVAAVALEPSRGDLQANMVHLAELLGEGESAARHASILRDQRPFDLDLQLQIASCLGRQERFEDARDVVAAIVDICKASKMYAHFHDVIRSTTESLGWARRRVEVAGAVLGDLYAVKALAHLCRYFEKRPDARLAARIRDLLLRLGKKSEAADWARRHLGGGPCEGVELRPQGLAVAAAHARPGPARVESTNRPIFSSTSSGPRT